MNINVINSFILIKPDILDNSLIISEIEELLMNNDLKVNRKRNVILSENDVDIMWPKFKYDYVTSEMLKLYITNKELVLYHIEGEHAIQKTTKIKNKIRNKHAKSSYIINCIHTPSDNLEYEEHLGCMINTARIINTTNGNKNLDVDRRCVRYRELEVIRFKKCAKVLWNQFTSNFDNFENMKEKNLKNKHSLVLNYNSSSLNEVVAALFECYSNWEIEDAYKAAFLAKFKGEYPIEKSDSEIEIRKNYEFLKSFNFDVKVVINNDVY